MPIIADDAAMPRCAMLSPLLMRAAYERLLLMLIAADAMIR